MESGLEANASGQRREVTIFFSRTLRILPPFPIDAAERLSSQFPNISMN